MAEAGSLTFEFGADFSGFTRATESAGAQLDRLTQATVRWTQGPARGLTSVDGTAGSNDQAGRVLTRLSEQLALLQSTGTAHAAIAEQMKTEAAQAKLGADATDAQKAAAATLVRHIDQAAAAQTRLRTAQQAVTEAWRFGSNELASGIEGLILRGEKLKDVLASILSSVARQGLAGALTGSGPFAGLFGTQSSGGLFGAIGSLFGAGTGSGFSGLYASGGTIDAGRWGIVGEKGAEVVAGPAAVVPWSKLGGRSQGSTQVFQFNVTTPDAPSFARSEAQMSALVARAVARGQRNG